MLRRMVRAVSSSERGAAAVEMALVLPLLVVLGLGAVELARTIWQYQVVTKGVRDGVRYLTRVPVTCAGGVGTFNDGNDVTVAENLVMSGTGTVSTPILPTYADADFNIDVTCTDDDDLGEVRLIRMTVEFPFDEWFAGLLGLSDLTFNITHEQIHVGE
jgi:Flp pilus assembly protein TadG